MRVATDQLRDIRGGLMVDELGEQLAAVVTAVLSTGKKGSVTLKLSVDPASKGDAVVTVTDEIKASIPQEKKTGTLMFALPSGAMQRQDPRQTELNLKAVDGGKPALQGTTTESAPLRAVAGN